jgi:all-trans-retinol 13,14-reductase
MPLSSDSRVGKKVLLLEQYTRLGGLTHSFSRNGFTWDAGIHYLGEMGPEDRGKALLDWLSGSPIEMTPLGDIYDTLHIGDAAPIELTRPSVIQKLDLKQRFPDDTDAIDAWYEALRLGKKVLWTIFQLRLMPPGLGKVLKWWNRRAIKQWCKRTTAQVANDLTDNPELAAVFSAQWGDFGGRPATTSFAMHALVISSYLEGGGYYPAGGGAAIADAMVATITDGGGQARTGVKVSSLLLENDRVIGVTTSDGENILADHVISDIGARETVEKLLPPEHGHQEWVKEIRSLGSNICHFSLFLGFSGDIEAAGATKSNHWLYPTGETDVVWTDVLEHPPPAMFVSFASLKDPDHDPGPDSKYAGEIIAWADWSTVKQTTRISNAGLKLPCLNSSGSTSRNWPKWLYFAKSRHR